MQSFEENFRYYKSQHRTLGCKITHMIGVPLIALSFPVFLFSFRRAVTLLAYGWVLQFIGHYFFEKNKPVLFRELSPMTLLSALVYVSESWYQLANGVPLAELGKEESIAEWREAPEH